MLRHATFNILTTFWGFIPRLFSLHGLVKKCVTFNKSFLQFIFKCNLYCICIGMRREIYNEIYSLSPKEISRANPEGFPKGSGYILLYFPTWVPIQSFSITTPALTFLGVKYWKSWFSVLLQQLGKTGKYCPVDWAILES